MALRTSPYNVAPLEHNILSNLSEGRYHGSIIYYKLYSLLEKCQINVGPTSCPQFQELHDKNNISVKVRRKHMSIWQCLSQSGREPIRSRDTAQQTKFARGVKRCYRVRSTNLPKPPISSIKTKKCLRNIQL